MCKDYFGNFFPSAFQSIILEGAGSSAQCNALTWNIMEGLANEPGIGL